MKLIEKLKMFKQGFTVHVIKVARAKCKVFDEICYSC